MPSGAGFIGGYGAVARSGYATPADLGPKPWALAFQGEAGWESFPLELRVDPVANRLRWRTEDWDPGLRFWTLPFDRNLSEWLQDVDLSTPSAMAAREFAGQHDRWSATDQKSRLANPVAAKAWILASDLAWDVDPAKSTDEEKQAAWAAIQREINTLADLMRNERRAFLDEAWLQSDGIPAYFLHFLGIDRTSKPWTMELIRCGLSIGNLVYMHYKDHYRRVRPSVVCPGLVPPWGPPAHPAFPSGHSFLGHFIALLLLDVPGIALRFGVFEPASARKGRPPSIDDFIKGGRVVPYGEDMCCPLLWLAFRLARNRERIGVHYPSDSSASRWLARGIHEAIRTGDADPEKGIDLPALRLVRARAESEWSAA